MDQWKDEIVEEVRAARDAYAAQFDYDLDQIVADLKLKQARHPELLAPLRSVERQVETGRP